MRPSWVYIAQITILAALRRFSVVSAFGGETKIRC